MAVALQSETEWRIPKMTIGRRMRWAREDAGISGEQMAQLMGVSSGTISNWESGTQPRNFDDVIRRWADHTRAPSWWLLTGKDLAPSTTCFSWPHLALVDDPASAEQLDLAFDFTPPTLEVAGTSTSR